MNPTEQIKALAELDGHKDPRYSMGKWYSYEVGIGDVFNADYPTSYDAIIPLIQKQPPAVMIDFTYHLWRIVERDAKRSYNIQYDAWRLIVATPSQLCEALLRATGK